MSTAEQLAEALEVLEAATSFQTKKARDNHGRVVKGLREALAAHRVAEKAEPVAWRAFVDGMFFHAASREGLIQALQDKLARAPIFVEPLYAGQPPASDRVPMTDQQIEAIWCEVAEKESGLGWTHLSEKFARAIERAHGITAPKEEV